MKKLSFLIIFILVSCSDTGIANEQKVEEVVKYITTEELNSNFTNLFCRTESSYGGFRNTLLKFNVDDEKAYLFLDYGGKVKHYEKELVENPSWVETSIDNVRQGDHTQWDFWSQSHDIYDHLVFIWTPSKETKKQFPNLSKGTRVNINRELLTGWRTHRTLKNDGSFGWAMYDMYEEPCKIITHEEVVKLIPTVIKENKESIKIHREYYQKYIEERESKKKI